MNRDSHCKLQISSILHLIIGGKSRFINATYQVGWCIIIFEYTEHLKGWPTVHEKKNNLLKLFHHTNTNAMLYSTGHALKECLLQKLTMKALCSWSKAKIIFFPYFFNSSFPQFPWPLSPFLVEIHCTFLFLLNRWRENTALATASRCYG